MTQFDNFIRPRRIVVVGASDDAGRVGGRLPQLLAKWGFPGEVCLVARHPVQLPHSAAGRFVYYRSVQEAAANGVIDLAVLATGPTHIRDALAECAVSNITHAIVFSSGNSPDETDELTTWLADFCATTSMTVIGPQSAGAVFAGSRLPATIMRRLMREEPFSEGPVGILTNSGGMANEVLLALQERGIGVGAWISLGTEAAFTMGSGLRLMREVPGIRVVLTIVESVMHGEDMLEAATELALAGIDVLSFRTLTSAVAEGAARLHSGRVNRPGGMWRASAGWSGITEVDLLDGLVNAVPLLHALPGTPSRQLTAAIVSNSGGGAVVGQDRLMRMTDRPEGTLKFPGEVGDAAAEQLRELKMGSALPCDVGATSADRYARICDAVLRDSDIDLLWAQVSSVVYFEDVRPGLVKQIDEIATSAAKPILVSGLGSSAKNDARMPGGWATAVRSLDDGIGTLGVLGALVQTRRKSGTRHGGTCLGRAQAVADGLTADASLAELLELARRWGLSTPDFTLVQSPFDAAFDWTRFPCVVKANSTEHKAQAGLVHRNVHSPEELRSALAALHRKRVDSAIIQAQLDPGQELILAAGAPAGIGPCMVVGRGGTATDEDAVRQVIRLPVTDTALDLALELLIQNGAVSPDIRSARAALHHVASILIGALDAVPDMAGIEFNPVIVHGTHAWVVDCRVG